MSVALVRIDDRPCPGKRHAYEVRRDRSLLGLILAIHGRAYRRWRRACADIRRAPARRWVTVVRGDERIDEAPRFHRRRDAVAYIVRRNLP